MTRRTNSGTLFAGLVLCLLTGFANTREGDVDSAKHVFLDAEEAAERVCWREGDDFVRCVEEGDSTPAENMESAQCKELRFRLYACIRITARVLPRFGEIYSQNGTLHVGDAKPLWSSGAVPHEFLRAFKLEKDQTAPPETLSVDGSPASHDGWSRNSHCAGEPHPSTGESDGKPKGSREWHGQVETPVRAPLASDMCVSG